MGCSRWVFVLIFSYARETFKALESGRFIKGATKSAEGHDYYDAINVGG